MPVGAIGQGLGAGEAARGFRPVRPDQDGVLEAPGNITDKLLFTDFPGVNAATQGGAVAPSSTIVLSRNSPEQVVRTWGAEAGTEDVVDASNFNGQGSVTLQPGALRTREENPNVPDKFARPEFDANGPVVVEDLDPAFIRSGQFQINGGYIKSIFKGDIGVNNPFQLFESNIDGQSGVFIDTPFGQPTVIEGASLDDFSAKNFTLSGFFNDSGGPAGLFNVVEGQVVTDIADNGDPIFGTPSGDAITASGRDADAIFDSSADAGADDAIGNAGTIDLPDGGSDGQDDPGLTDDVDAAA